MPYPHQPKTGLDSALILLGITLFSITEGCLWIAMSSNELSILDCTAIVQNISQERTTCIIWCNATGLLHQLIDCCCRHLFICAQLTVPAIAYPQKIYLRLGCDCSIFHLVILRKSIIIGERKRNLNL